MSTFAQLHPDVIEVLPTVKLYKRLDIKGTIVEAWEQDDQGHMRDVTAREKAKQAAERALEATKRKLAALQEATV